MGFFKKMFEVAGSKAGSAIGNSLWGNSTDYVRVGSSPNMEDEMYARQEERIYQKQIQDARRAEEQMDWIMRQSFDPTDIDYNLTVLANISALLDSLPKSRLSRSEEENRVYNAGKSKFESGVLLCKAKDPRNPGLLHFERKCY